MIFTKNRQRGDPNLCLEDYEVRGVRPCRESGILGGGSSGAGGSANIIDFDVFVGLRPGTQSPGHVVSLFLLNVWNETLDNMSFLNRSGFRGERGDVSPLPRICHSIRN